MDVLEASATTVIGSVKDDTDEALPVDDGEGNPTTVDYKATVTKCNDTIKHSKNPTAAAASQNNENESDVSVGLCYWTVFQVVGLASVAIIVYRSVMYRQGYFEVPSDYSDLIFITSVQYSNWHYSLTTIGFIYLYANSILMAQKNRMSDVTPEYVMLHTLAYAVSASGLYAVYANKETNKHKTAKFYEGHLYSMHGWVGVCAASMFTAQWLSAVAAFAVPRCLWRAGPSPGRVFSLYTVFVSSVAILTGVNQHAVKSLKEAYRSYSTESLILNGFGMLIVVFLLLFVIVVLKLNKTSGVYVLYGRQ